MSYLVRNKNLSSLFYSRRSTDEPCSSKDATIEDLRLEIEEMKRTNAQQHQMMRELDKGSTNTRLMDIVEQLTDNEADIAIKQGASTCIYTSFILYILYFVCFFLPFSFLYIFYIL